MGKCAAHVELVASDDAWTNWRAVSRRLGWTTPDGVRIGNIKTIRVESRANDGDSRVPVTQHW